MPPAVPVDTWPTLPPSPTKSASGITPTRASRTKGITNDVAYSSFTRTPVRGPAVTYELGDAVVVGPSFVPRQKWLGIPASFKRVPSKSKGKGKGKAKRVAVEEVDDGWSHEDGLAAGEKVALIVGLYEDVVGRKMGRLRWLARPGAVWSADGPVEGEEVDPYELYYTADSTFLYETRTTRDWEPGSFSSGKVTASHKTALSTDSLLLSHITSRVSLSSPDSFDPEAKKVGHSFVIKKVYDAKPRAGGEFIGEVKWDEIFERGMREGDWDTEEVRGEDQESEDEVVAVRTTKAEREEKERERQRARKRKFAAAAERGGYDSESDDSDGPDVSDDGYGENDTEVDSDGEPVQRRRAATKSPRKRVVPRIAPQVQARNAYRSKKRIKFLDQKYTGSTGVPPTFTTSDAFKKLSPFEQARALLHVSATPEFLPRREDEREKIRSMLGGAILSQTGTCLYIHGVPGTGKTATVHSVVRDLQQDADMDPFQFVEINGMKISEPNTSFSLLWEALSGQKAPARQALSHLENHFQTPDPSRKTTVVLVDELDQMLTKRQDVIYNFFNWPHVPHSRLIVIAIANTMDLPERELSGKIRSRLGSNRVPFSSYGWQDLEAILEARLGNLKVFAPMALQRIAKLVAGVSGDARRALDISRRSVEKVDQENQVSSSPRLCTLQDVSTTYKEMTNYGSNLFVKRASLMEKVFLLSLSSCVRRAGINEVEVGDVMQHHLSFLSRASLTPIPSQSELFTLLASLHSLRLLASDSTRLDYFAKVRALVEDVDLFAALAEEPELKSYVPKR